MESKRKANKLSALGVEKAKHVGRYSDGLGLYLFIVRPGEKVWTFRYTRDGRSREMSLGPLHSVSLAEARERARQARQLILDGKDPIAVKHAVIAEAKVAALRTLTFEQAARQFLETERVQQFRNDKHRRQWTATLESYAFPVIGDLPLEQIDSAIILNALLPVYRRTWETGYRTHGRVERVFRWAIAHKLFTGENPGAFKLIKDALPARPKAAHHAALPYAELPGFFSELRRKDSISARCLEFTILTAMRTGEVIKARWSEIDLEAAIWTCPKTKNGKPHRVPLSDRAVELLRGLKTPSKSEAVFINGGGKPLSNMAMSELLKGMVPPERATVHGFRSTFSDWARDHTSYPRDVIEMCLAHTIKDKSEAAYRRGDAIDKRRRLMDAWAQYCEGGFSARTENVHKIRERA